MYLLPVSGSGTIPSQSLPIDYSATDPAQQPNTAEPDDTSPPAPANEANSTSDTSTSQQTDPETQTAKTSAASTDTTAAPVAASTSGNTTSTVQSVVEAQVAEPPASSKADARRLAEAAQQRQKLELLIEAVGTKADTPSITAAAADQAEVGTTDTDGNPL